MNLKEVKFVTIDNKNYLLSNETNNELFVFCIDDQLTIAHFDDLLGAGIQWVKNIAIEPEQIGLVHEGVDSDGIHKIVPINNEHIETIKANNGKCMIEVDILTLQTLVDYDPTKDKSFQPILIDDKVVIHL